MGLTGCWGLGKGGGKDLGWILSLGDWKTVILMETGKLEEKLVGTVCSGTGRCVRERRRTYLNIGCMTRVQVFDF